MNKYTIVVNNNSGDDQNYVLFSEKPKVTGGVVTIWSNVYQTADSTSDGAQAEFDMWKQYYAMTGTIKGGQTAGAEVKITQSVPVTLGQKQNDGTVVSGTTLSMVVKGGVTPAFNKTPESPTAYANSFEVDTGSDFDFQTAKSLNFMVGIGSSPDNSSGVVTASFIPEPGCEYQIQPVNTYYIAFGNTFSVGQLLDVAKLAKHAIAVDFTKLPIKVVVEHTATGQLVIQK